MTAERAEAPRKEEGKPTENASFSERWTDTIQSFMKPVLGLLKVVTRHAAMNPKAYAVSIIILSVGLMAIGLATNFTIKADGDVWTPQDTRSAQHGAWIASKQSGFPNDPRYMTLIVHRDGKNILGNDDDFALAQSGVQRMFQAIQVVQNISGYDALCSKRAYVHPVTNQTTCDINGVSNYWNDNATLFQQTVSSNEDVIVALSAKQFPSGRGVDFDQIIGYNQCDNGAVDCQIEGALTSGKSYVTTIGLPSQDEVQLEASELETKAINSLRDLQDAWEKEEDNDGFHLDFLAYRSFDDEFNRALSSDYPLLPCVFILMSILCVGVFSQRDPVLSRGWLGFGAVVTVLLALIASFGLLFLLGIPFTNLTGMLPFIIFGIGLDDAFIIFGSYQRTDQTKDAVERISDTIEEAGGAILLSTLTTSVAFALGMCSSVPSVQYLAAYAFPTIMIDFAFMVTFFVSLIVLDERRIQQNRRNCCCCCRHENPLESEGMEQAPNRHPKKHFADRGMAIYSNFLLRPATKAVVLVLFTALFAGMAYSTSLLEQYFDFTVIFPDDSYVHGWWNAFQDHNENSGTVRAGIYFRDVDFSLESTRQYAYAYVQELVDMPYTGRYPTYNFWLAEFDKYIVEANITELPFNEQLDQFLGVNIYEFHKQNIVLDDNGNMVASRTVLAYDNLDYKSGVRDTIDALRLQDEISENQQINHGLKDWFFFTWAEDYFIWEFYKVCPGELVLTTLLGTASVSFLALLFIPHWSAVFIVFFMMACLYIDLLGFIQLCGISVGPGMYISVVMSIGLMVDFVIHVTYRYMEVEGNTREDKTKKTLETIGASVMVGGFSTLIGVLPLGFSSSEIIFTVFIVFFGLVLMGLLHGLVLLPVLLSICGPMVVLRESSCSEVEEAESELDGSSTAEHKESSSVDPAADYEGAAKTTQEDLEASFSEEITV